MKILSETKFSEIINPQLIEAECQSDGSSGGISTTGKFVESDYFSQLKKLGDFDSATTDNAIGSYHYPYLDFGISQIYGKFHYVIGLISNSKQHYSLSWQNFSQ